MIITAFGLSDIGKLHEENQDALLIDPKHHVYAVADGVGSLPDAAESSQLAIETLQLYINGSATIGRQEGHALPADSFDFQPLFQHINQVVHQRGIDNHSLMGMGTTLTAVQIIGTHLLIGHVGDSSVLLFHEHTWEMCTKSHTMDQAIYDNLPHGKLIQNIPDAFVDTLTRCIGQETYVQADTIIKQPSLGDRVLICTDGITKMIEERELFQLLLQAKDPQSYVETLIATANEYGGHDNATAIALFFDGE